MDGVHEDALRILREAEVDASRTLAAAARSDWKAAVALLRLLGVGVAQREAEPTWEPLNISDTEAKAQLRAIRGGQTRER